MLSLIQWITTSLNLYTLQFIPLLKEAFGERFLRIVVESFHKLYIRSGALPAQGLKNGNKDPYIRLRRQQEYGLAVRFAVLLRPHKDNFYSALYMWHFVNGYTRLTSLNDRLFLTPDIVRTLGKYFCIIKKY